MGKEEGSNGHVAVAVPEEGVAMLTALPEEKQMVVEFNTVSCWVPNLFGAPSTMTQLKNMAALKNVKKVSVKSIAAVASHKEVSAAEAAAKENMRQVLYNVSGKVKPGELLALMGPSGGGKTTLLSILGGRTPKGARMDGSVLFNGGALNKRAKRQTGYVMQDDLLYETLTVFETLYFAAMLRLPAYMTKAQKKERVEVVIKALGLMRCRDTIIGGFFRRGVSGGERKRVSVGHELLIDPSVLLLDEPTSGLDSTTARNLLQLLRDLASSGRSIVTTIHQPSSRLYQQLDKVMLLSQGHAIYYGQGAAAAEWFGQLGVQLPYGVNVADFLLDIASGEIVGKERSDEEARVHLVEVSETFLAEHPEGYQQQQKLDVSRFSESASAIKGQLSVGPVVALEDVSSDGSSPQAAVANGTSVRFDIASQAVELGEKEQHAEGGGRQGQLARSNTSMNVARPGASRWGATYWTQLQVLFLRAVKVRRFETLSKQDFIQFLIVGAICGMIWWQVGRHPTTYSASNTVGLLFFEALFLSFRTLFTALFTFPNEYKMMLKERASGMYRLSAFYLARTASDLPMDCSVPSLFVIIIYLMGGLRRGGYFFANWAAIILSSLVAQSFGLLIGATVMVPKTAQTIASVLMLGFMLVGGFYVQNIPSWISWLKWLSFITYAYNLLIKIEFGGVTLYDCGAQSIRHPQDDPNCFPVTDNQAALKMFVNPNGPVWEVGVLFGFLIFFRFLVYVALRKKTASR
ncbi:hypothetical protein N2152v2_008602 [Parachlorella kessleri]